MTRFRANEQRERRVRIDCRFMFRPVCLLTGLGIGLLLGSCSWQEAIQQHREQKGRMERSLNAYVGKSVADVANERGPPSGTTDMGPDKRGFEWEITTETPEAAKPAPGSRIAATVPASQQTCLVSFVARTTSPTPTLSDWIIESTQWKGGSC
jgi:hypothetical protein